MIIPIFEKPLGIYHQQLYILHIEIFDLSRTTVIWPKFDVTVILNKGFEIIKILVSVFIPFIFSGHQDHVTIKSFQGLHDFLLQKGFYRFAVFLFRRIAFFCDIPDSNKGGIGILLRHRGDGFQNSCGRSVGSISCVSGKIKGLFNGCICFLRIHS